MSEVKEIKAFAALPLMSFDRKTLIENLQGNDIGFTESAHRRIYKLTSLSLDCPVDLYLVHVSDVITERWGNLDQELLDLEAWYEEVKHKFDLEPCPDIVAPMLALSPMADKDAEYIIAASPLGEGQTENFKLYYPVSGRAMLTTSNALPGTEDMHEYWIFCKRR